MLEAVTFGLKDTFLQTKAKRGEEWSFGKKDRFLEAGQSVQKSKTKREILL